MDGMLWDSPLRCGRCGLWSTNLQNPADLASPAVANGVCRAVTDRILECSGFEELIQTVPPGYTPASGCGQGPVKQLDDPVDRKSGAC